jgi:hypothetical protein
MKQADVPGSSLMVDASHMPQAVLELSGDKFDEQPSCWQNMVKELEEADAFFHMKFVKTISKHLAKFHLTYVHNLYPEASHVKGTTEDLTAWMLAYA